MDNYNETASSGYSWELHTGLTMDTAAYRKLVQAQARQTASMDVRVGHNILS